MRSLAFACARERTDLALPPVVSPPKYVIYCDKADDEILAKELFSTGALAGATVTRLPPRGDTLPAELRDSLEWERSDWLVTRDEVLVGAAEITRHGYTGDNGLQRFARLVRAASLGVPVVYFTPFSRSRLNELDEGRNSPRNVSPEMFGELLQAGDAAGVPCIALRWPTDQAFGEPFPLSDAAMAGTLETLKQLVEGFATLPRDRLWDCVPPAVMDAMREQAAIPVRGTDVRLVVDTPIEVETDEWLHALLPATYMSSGKADKVLAKMALDSVAHRPLPSRLRADLFWTEPGRAQVLYLGYQWRPDPACGLIAHSGALAKRAGLPLIVVWPRIFLADSEIRQSLLRSLSEFKRSGKGMVLEKSLELGLPREKILAFQQRINIDSKQFGLFSERSKVGRILKENADLCVFGDGLYVP
jgi:hypothetical protein